MKPRSWGPAQGQSWGPATRPHGIGLSWEEIRKRSTSPGAPDCYCFDCWLHFQVRGVPCLKHTLPSERAARAKAIGVTR